MRYYERVKDEQEPPCFILHPFQRCCVRGRPFPHAVNLVTALSVLFPFSDYQPAYGVPASWQAHRTDEWLRGKGFQTQVYLLTYDTSSDERVAYRASRQAGPESREKVGKHKNPLNSSGFSLNQEADVYFVI